MSNFDNAFAFVVGLEGGVSNNAQDPGGLTKYGISQRAYPDLDIANLTLDQAKAIYLRDYWSPLNLDTLLYGDALCIFDSAVNQGIGRATQLLTIVSTSDPDFIIHYQAERALYYAKLETWTTFGRGWVRRLLTTAVEASK